MIDMSLFTVSRLERDLNEPKSSTIGKLARALDIPVEALLTSNGDEAA